MGTVSMMDELAWRQRRGRRESDAEVPNTRQVTLIAHGLGQLIGHADNADEAREIVRSILPFISRGSDVAFMLGTEPGDLITREGPTDANPS